MIIYRSLVVLLLPLFFIYTLKRSFGDGDRRYFFQRSGWGLPRYTDRPLWLHCASVGEVRAVASLIHAILENYPGIPVVVSTVTPTGAEMVKKILPDDISHIYLPFDLTASVKRFVSRINPRAALIMETELWPNLFAEMGRQKIPLVIINGRLSNKTLNASNWMKAAYRNSLANVRRVLARNQSDGDGFIALGMEPDRVDVLGNLKFASQADPVKKQSSEFPRPYWLAASTHEGEERLLAEIQRSMETPWLLVIAPRHPERSAAIQAQLKSLGVMYSVRSKKEPVTAVTQVYLADTLGEMPWLMKFSQLVFMGGSLVPVGGHNLLEPAALGCPIVTGSRLDNFEQEAKLLREYKAMIEISGPAALEQTLRILFHNKARLDELGQAARQAFDSQQGVLERYLQALDTLGLFR